MRLVKKELLYLYEKELKKKIVTRIMAMMMVAGTMFGTVNMTSFAAETTTAQTAQSQAIVKQALKADVVAKVFDATYYAEKNPDVVAVIGNDPAVLLQHYIDFGIYEGRDASAIFNATIYAAANTDLMTVFGDNLEALIGHYVDFGQAEGRVASNDALKANGVKFVPASSGASSSGSVSSDTNSSGTSGSVLGNSGWFTYDDSYWHNESTGLTSFLGGSNNGYDENGTFKIVLGDGRQVELGEYFRFDDEPENVYHVYKGGDSHYTSERVVKEDPTKSWTGYTFTDNGDGTVSHEYSYENLTTGETWTETTTETSGSTYVGEVAPEQSLDSTGGVWIDE